MNAFALIMALAVAAAGGAIVYWSHKRSLEPAGGLPAAMRRRGAIRMPCSVCRREMVFTPQDLQRLSPAEVALVSRTVRDAATRKLAEYICPSCEASHCFLVDTSKPHLIGVNLYEPQSTTGHCMECRRPLVTPPWPKGEFDGRVCDVSRMAPEYGLICSKCGAVACYACCLDATRNRTRDGALYCPRCMRPGVETFYHSA